MRRTLLALATLVALAACGGGGDTPTEPGTTNPPSGTIRTTALTTSHTLVVDGFTRSYMVYAPAGVSTTQALPMVIMLHGTSGNGAEFYERSGWKEKCEAVKCIAVFPTAREVCYIDNGKNTVFTKWTVASLVPCNASVVFADDVKFMRQMVADLKARYAIDAKRVYVTGFSNGGSFSSKLWAEAPDLFAAVASSSGFDLQASPATNTVPFYFTVGEFDDEMIIVAGYPQGFPLTESALDIPFFKVIGGSALTRLGLNTTHTTTTNAAGITFRYTSPSSAGTEMYFSIVKGQTHEYPNGTNYPLRAADVFWTFFSSHSKP
jgi:polyhydroxybutyrate depolymerase